MQNVGKKASIGLGKNVVLLGQNKQGENIWLEYPRFDCKWYWGFGYLEVYAMKNGNYQADPSKAYDISSHSHFSGAVGQMEYYDTVKQCFCKGEYIHTLDKNPDYSACVLNESELWQLSELFKRFYLLQELAAYYYTGGCNCTTLPYLKFGGVSNDKVKCIENWQRINTVEIPPIMEAIIKLLHPTPQDVSINIPDLTIK